jgi:hypothetical protein
MSPDSPPPSHSARLPFDGRILAIQMAFAAAVAIALGVQALRASPDFSYFWAAHHVPLPYDSTMVSRAIGPKTSFFPYPPTFLLMTLPLKWVSLPVGYYGWLGLSAAGLMASLRRFSAPLALIAPSVLMAEIAGQTSLAMAALLFAAATTRDRAWLVGLLLGLALCIKPQVAVLVPLVLLAAGQWRALAGAAATVALMSLAATAVYGLHIWSDWLQSLPGFLAANDGHWTGRYLALPGPWKLAALAGGALAAIHAGRQGRVELGVFIAVAAAFLGSLHAMDYDGAVLAPFAVSQAFSNRWSVAPYLVAAAFPPNVLTTLALALLATGSLLAASAPWAASKQNRNML